MAKSNKYLEFEDHDLPKESSAHRSDHSDDRRKATSYIFVSSFLASCYSIVMKIAMEHGIGVIEGVFLKNFIHFSFNFVHMWFIGVSPRDT